MEYHIKSLSDINENLRDELQRFLIPGEEVIWLDKPAPKKNFKAKNTKKNMISLVVLFIVIYAFEVFYFHGELEPTLPKYSGFILAVLFIYIYISYVREKTLLNNNVAFYDMVYVLTTKRAILIQGSDKFIYWDCTPQKPNRIEIKKHPDGTGDIIFEYVRVTYPNSYDPGYKMEPRGFFSIICPDETYAFAKDVALKNNPSFAFKH